jgi:hypothetical protein
MQTSAIAATKFLLFKKGLAHHASVSTGNNTISGHTYGTVGTLVDVPKYLGYAKA